MARPEIDPATGNDPRQKAGLGDSRDLRNGQRSADYPIRMGASGGLSGRWPPRSSRRLGSRGFTVVELVAVMALLGLLSTMGLIIGRNVAQAAKASSTVTQIAYIQKALANMATHCEGLPVYSSTGDPGLVKKSTRN